MDGARATPCLTIERKILKTFQGNRYYRDVYANQQLLSNQDRVEKGKVPGIAFG
jgi:hypothetical protein